LLKPNPGKDCPLHPVDDISPGPIAATQRPFENNAKKDLFFSRDDNIRGTW
jgi:hypothetical protein